MGFSFAAYPGIEKLLLLSAAVVVFVVVAACAKLLGRTASQRNQHQSGAIEFLSDQDPNSLRYTGAGPGIQGFGIYAGGVRIAHDHIDDD